MLPASTLRTLSRQKDKADSIDWLRTQQANLFCSLAVRLFPSSVCSSQGGRRGCEDADVPFLLRAKSMAESIQPGSLLAAKNKRRRRKIRGVAPDAPHT